MFGLSYGPWAVSQVWFPGRRVLAFHIVEKIVVFLRRKRFSKGISSLYLLSNDDYLYNMISENASGAPEISFYSRLWVAEPA